MAVGVVVVAPVSILIAVSFKYVNFHYFRLNDVDFMGCLLILMLLGWGLTLICLFLVDVWLGCGWLDLTKPKLQCRTEEGFFVDYQYDFILNTLMNKEIHLAN
ncbi:MAG: hypothetical protein Q8M03_10130 [Legionella sp.]|nr:hypothetical protein [Legionella sp.]